jgi:hypothetical protein
LGMMKSVSTLARSRGNTTPVSMLNFLIVSLSLS